ncbi:MAG: toxin-antitoxin system HicB family antitoxin [Chloroflexi bacterium]|nr:toxin-antitoxin system HicB family antitoxin [Chloroflexota bacterium]
MVTKDQAVTQENYTYRVLWSEEDQEFIGLVAEFPSLSWLENTQLKALSGIIKLVGEILEEMEESGETPPAPLALRDYSGHFTARVTPETHRNLHIEAAEANVSFSRHVSAKLSR